jgi:beta-galactosidase GanA
MKKAILIIFAVIVVLYGVLWLCSFKKYPVEWGISFNHNHAASLGSEWQDVYQATIFDLKPSYIRIAAMWNDIEREQGEYWFGDIDWMMHQAKDAGVKVLLVVGQKAPRWPECHVPDWTSALEQEEYNKALLTYVSAVTERYKDHEALYGWQVENEPFIKFRFGECERFNEQIVKEEIAVVQSTDPDHNITITDSV